MQLKDEKDKLFYEIDWSFIEKMAERMSKNKNKYPPFNWQNGENIKGINQAITRHFIEIQKGVYSDDQHLGHYIALAVNAMIAVYQLENKVPAKKDLAEFNLRELIKEYPNDIELGEAIRRLVK